jgi:hypothetical protein
MKSGTSGSRLHSPPLARSSVLEQVRWTSALWPSA